MILRFGMFFALFLFNSQPQAQASGIKLHMLMADRAVEKLEDATLKDLLMREQIAYLNGVIFPDAGILMNGKYGEFAHSSAYFNLYLEGLLQSCPLPSLYEDADCAKRLAFFLGAVAHRMGDTHFDRYFVTETAQREFEGNLQKAQHYTDFWLDYIAIVDLPEAASFPAKWNALGDANAAFQLAFERKLIRTQVPAELVERTVSLQYWINVVAMQRFAHILAPRGRTMGVWANQNYVSAPGGIEDSSVVIAQLWDSFWKILLDGDSIPVFEQSGQWPLQTFSVR